MDPNKCSEAASPPTHHQQKYLQMRYEKPSCSSGGPRNDKMEPKIPYEKLKLLKALKIIDQDPTCSSGGPRNDNMEPKMPCGWSKDEKLKLLQALKVNGQSNIDKVQKSITTKSSTEIDMMIEYYKTKAARKSMVQNRKSEERVQDITSHVPLTMWMQLLINRIGYENLRTVTADAIRIIAETETIPPPEMAANYDFRAVYHTIANAMERKSLKADEKILNVIETCLFETAKNAKNFMSTDVLKEILHSIDLKNTHFGVTDYLTVDMKILQDLACQKNYNPLNIQRQYLKPQSGMKKKSKN